MAVTNPNVALIFSALYPNSSEPFQRLVMAAADSVNNKGKRAWFGFGEDKGKTAFFKFMHILTNELRFTLVEDGKISDPNDEDRLLIEIENALNMFIEAYPNWGDAEFFIRLVIEKSRAEKVAE